MSLSNILDPVCTAYWRRASENGNTYSSGVVCIPYNGATQENANELGLCFVSDFAPGIEQIKSGVYIYNDDESAEVQFGGATVVFETLTEGELTFIAGRSSSVDLQLIYIFTDNVTVDGLEIKKGTYVAPYNPYGFVIFELT